MKSGLFTLEVGFKNYFYRSNSK